MTGCLDFMSMGNCGEGDEHDRILSRFKFQN